MRKHLCLAFLYTIVFTAAFCQDKEYKSLAVTRQPLLLLQPVHLKLDLSKAKTLDVQKDIYAVMFYYRSGKMWASDTLMKKGSKFHTATFLIPDSVDLVVFKFMQGNKEENNEGQGYFFEVFDRSGQHQVGADYSFYRIFSGGDGITGVRGSKPEIAKRYHDKWFRAQDLSKMSYPEKVVAYYVQKDTAALCDLLKNIPKNRALTEDQLSMLSVYSRPCGSAASARIESEIKQQYPEGRTLLRPWLDSIRKFETIAEKMVWIKAFKLAYPDDSLKKYPFVSNLYFEVFRTAARNMDMTVIKDLINYQEKSPDDDRLASVSIDFASACFRKDTLVKEALNLTGYYLERLNREMSQPENWPMGQSKQMYLLSLRANYRQLASIHGGLLYRSGQYDSALVYTENAALGAEYKVASYNQKYFQVLEQMKPAAEVVKLMKPAFVNDGYNLVIKEQYARLYTAAGLGDGQAEVKALLAVKTTELQARIKKDMISKPAAAFSLPGLKGGNASLDALKGKVVLIDFWATWCGPCIASFPAMQMLVDANKGRNDVAILFVDTWQKESDKYAVVNKFFMDKPYRFDVYMDLDDKTVKDFGVKGIPTKVIIDKKGMIRFFSVGYSGDELKAVEELQAMIDLAAETSL